MNQHRFHYGIEVTLDNHCIWPLLTPPASWNRLLSLKSPCTTIVSEPSLLEQVGLIAIFLISVLNLFLTQPLPTHPWACMKQVSVREKGDGPPGFWRQGSGAATVTSRGHPDTSSRPLPGSLPLLQLYVTRGPPAELKSASIPLLSIVQN